MNIIRFQYEVFLHEVFFLNIKFAKIKYKYNFSSEEEEEENNANLIGNHNDPDEINTNKSLEFDDEDFNTNYQNNNIDNIVGFFNPTNNVVISDNSALKLTISSSSSSSSISSLDSSLHTKQRHSESPESPIYISSCSAASSISSTSSALSSNNKIPQISPNSISSDSNQSTYELPQPIAINTSNQLHMLANDSGVCTTSTSSVISCESSEVKKFNNNRNKVKHLF